MMPTRLAPLRPAAALALPGAMAIAMDAPSLAGALVRLGLLLASLAALTLVVRHLLGSRRSIALSVALSFAAGVLYQGLAHVLDARRAAAFAQVFAARAEWIGFGLAGVAALVALRVLHGWYEAA